MIYDVWRDEEIQCFHWIFFPFPLVYLIHLSDMMSCISTVHVEWIALQIKSVFKLWWPDLHASVAKISCQVSFAAHSQEVQNSPFRLLDNQIFSLLHHKSPALGMSHLPLRHWKSVVTENPGARKGKHLSCLWKFIDFDKCSGRDRSI